MIDTLRALAKEYYDLESRYQDPAVLNDPKQIAKIGKRMAELKPLVGMLAEYDVCEKSEAFARERHDDAALQALAEEEAHAAASRKQELFASMRRFLIPKNPDDEKSVIIEVRAGTGGDEASLFAAELVKMYLRYAETHRWKTQMLDMTNGDAGGIKNATVRIEGNGVYGKLKFESGVHRVQRIPETEAKGRVHTSTVTVAILPEAEEVDIVIRPEDLRIDTFRSGGAGGQNVNKVESAIRITHIPTNTVVACQTERSQLQNRQNAMAMLRSRLYSAEQERLAKERGDLRSGQIGSGDRSEKVRTYNFPQDRLTDHRITKNFGNLPAIMEGDLDGVVEALVEEEEQQRLAAL